MFIKCSSCFIGKSPRVAVKQGKEKGGRGDRFAPSLAVFDKGGRFHCNLTAFTGGLGASSRVAFPSRQGVLLGMFSGSDIAFSMCTKGATFPPSPCIPKKLASHKLNFIFLKKFLSVIGPLYAALHFGQREERFYRDFKKSVSGQLSSQNALSFDKMYNSRQLTACCEIPSF